MTTTDERCTVVRYAAWVFLMHAVLVTVAVIMKHVFLGTDVPWWKLERLLLLVDMPMEWAIRPSLQSLPLLPGWMVFNSARIAAGVNEIFLHSLIGGAFYALIAAAIAYVRQRKRNATVMT